MFETHKITRSMSGINPQGAGDTGLKPGAMLQERYLIQGVLGTGGMGSVYKARDMRFPKVTKLVAVKEILNLAPDPAMRETVIRTFEREANTLATLNHPAIPKIYDYFSQGDRSFLVQEYIEGKDLEAYLNDQADFIPEDTVVEWAIQLCDVLSYLHGHPPEAIVFRDMKPSNVMLDNHTHIRLIDFGIARSFTSGEKGTMIGTEGYSPPEQYRGEASPAGDIYALGATLHHLLTKQDPRIEPPFSFGERPIRKTNPAVSVELEAIINTALSYNLGDRFTSAQAMKEALISLRRARTGVLNSRTIPMPAGGLAELAGSGAASTSTSAATSKAVSGEVAPIWTFKCEDEIRGSPLVANGTVFIGVYDNNLYAINAGDGALLWKYPTDGGLPGSPAMNNDSVFIGSEDKRLHAISLRSGRVVWTYYTDGPVRGSPRAAEGHVFVGSDDMYLHAVNINTGRRVWRSQATGPVRCRPAVSGDRVFFGCDGGEFYAVDFSGTQKWRFKAKRAIVSSPYLHTNGTIYVGSMDGMVYAMDSASGWLVWKFRTNKPVLSSPTVDGNTLFVGSADNYLYAVDIRKGAETWKYQTEGQVNSSPVVYKNTVYVGSVDGCVYAIDSGNGKLRWKFRSEAAITSSPVIFNDVLYIGSLDHSLYALAA